MTPSPNLWFRLGAAACGKGALDKVDLAVVRTLAARIGRPGDMAFPCVIGCLLATVRSGGLRIPLDPDQLAARLEDFLRGLVPSMLPDGATAARTTGADNALMEIVPSGNASSETEGWEAGVEVPDLARTLALEFTRLALEGQYAAVIGRVLPGSQPAFLPLLESGGGLYLQKHHAAEASVGLRLSRLIASPDSDPGADRHRDILNTVLHKLPLRLTGDPGSPAMEFDPAQREALAKALLKRFIVISGGPGTGKTSLAANLLRAWIRAWTMRPMRLTREMPGYPRADAAEAGNPRPRLPRIRLAAPTGRAAQRLAESLRRSLETVLPPAASRPDADADAALDFHIAALPCETLHSLLRYNPGTGEYFHRLHRPIPADLLIVDEVSMVDIFALSRLLEAIEEDACLVLLGDMDQLPSVDSGAVLADLVPNPGSTRHALEDNLVFLERSHRSQADILEVTRRINAMDGHGALAAMSAPMGPAAPWPATFLVEGRKTSPEGGCRLLEPPPHPGQAPGYRPGYRQGLDGWLEAWIRYQYSEYSLDPSRFPGRTLAMTRSAAYEELLGSLGRLLPPEDTAFQAGLARPASVDDPAFLDWLKNLAEAFAYLDQGRILTMTRKGWHGSEAVNRRIRERLARRWDPGAPPPSPQGPGTEGFHGAPILILENDPAKGLYNGDVGIQLRLCSRASQEGRATQEGRASQDGRALVLFRKAEGYQAFPVRFLPRHEIAFAMTVHKSQGSEYDQVMLVLPEPGNRLLYKESLYTALTRARYFAGIYGSREVFLEAVGRKVIRESGLRDYLILPSC